MNSGFPPTNTQVKASELKKNPYVAEFGKHADKSQFYLAGVKDFTKANANIFEPAIQRILNGRGSPQQVLTRADKQLETVLKE